MAGEENREIQLGGEGNRENDGRSNMKTGEEEGLKEGQEQLSSQSDVLRFTVDLGSFLGWIFFRSEDNSAPTITLRSSISRLDLRKSPFL